MITAEYLTLQLEGLEKQKADARELILRCEGAQQVVRHMLHALEQAQQQCDAEAIGPSCEPSENGKEDCLIPSD